MFEVEVQQARAQRYVSRTRHVRIEELAPFIMEAIRELRAGASGAPGDDEPLRMQVARPLG